MTIETNTLSTQIVKRLRQRNAVSHSFFLGESARLAVACREMAARFQRGGRLLAFGRGPYATDAQHVSVEFVHPVIVGKRALPALDLSLAFEQWLPALLRPDDIVMGFGPPEGDPPVSRMLRYAHDRGAQTFALPGFSGDYAVDAPSPNPFIHQEVMEVLYHTLWETVHVFLEHRERGHDVGESGFLYPFLGKTRQDTDLFIDEVATSIEMKAQDDETLRHDVAHQADHLAEAALAMYERLRMGGTFILFGNGGSATDANDWALDCVMPPDGKPAFPAISLSMEAANLSAIANDVGTENVFSRQLIAQARPEDIAVGISTSGSSANVVRALKEARKRGLLTVALAGYDGGEIAAQQLADFPLVVHSDYIPRLQEVHASIYHTLLETLYVLTDETA